MKKATRAALAIPFVLLLGACANGGGASSDSTSSAKSASDAGGSGGSTAARGEVAAAEPGSDTAMSTKGDGTQAGPLSRAVISTGQITLHASKLARARAEVERLVTSYGGTIADEKSSGDRHGRLTDSSLTLRVPTSKFDAAMEALGRVGEVEQQSRSSEDVTTQVIDNDARVRAAERSIRSIENLLSRAQKLGDVIAIESDLARRQADLDSLRQQQAWLSDQTSLSTINVYLSLPAAHHAKKVTAHGFLAGLRHGWHALGASTLAAMTVVGAVLPFGVLAAVIGVPVWWLVRRRRPAVAPPAVEA